MRYSPLQVGVIGYGYWGPNLLRNLQQAEDVEVVAVCDMQPDRLAIARNVCPSAGLFSTEADDLLESTEIDAIVIATPIATHFELCKKALEYGKHVLVEKPIAATSEEAERLIAIADENNLRLMVDHTFVYTGAVRMIRELIDRDELGDIYYFDSVRVNLGLFQHDVNVLWDLAPHDLAIMDYILKKSPISVSSVGVSHFDNDKANTAYLTLFFDGKMISHIHVNWLAPVKVRKTLISGSKKMVIYDDMEPSEKVKVYDRGVDFVRDRDAIYDMLVQYRTGDMRAPRIDLTEALAGVVREFCDSIEEERAPLTDGHAGLRVVKILEAADRSGKLNGVPVEIDSLA